MSRHSALVLRGSYLSQAALVLRTKLHRLRSRPIVIAVSPTPTVLGLFSQLVVRDGLAVDVWNSIHFVFIDDTVSISSGSRSLSHTFRSHLNHIMAEEGGRLKHYPLKIPPANFHHLAAVRPDYRTGVAEYESAIRGLKGGTIDLLIGSCEPCVPAPVHGRLPFSYAGINSGDPAPQDDGKSLLRLVERGYEMGVVPTGRLFSLAHEAIVLAERTASLLPLALFRERATSVDLCPVKLAKRAGRTLVLMPPLELVL